MVKTTRQKFWSKEIAASLTRYEDFCKIGKKIVQRYRKGRATDSNSETDKSFNILWSNTQILKAATLSRIPNPNVTRRYKDKQPVVRNVAELLERTLDYFKDEKEFKNALKNVDEDMLLPGRGTAWVNYDATFERIELELLEKTMDGKSRFGLNGQEMRPDGFGKPKLEEDPFIEALSFEGVSLDYVHWKDFAHSDGRFWEEVWWVGRKHGMDETKIERMFGKKALKKIEAESQTETDSEGGKREIFAVWEIWDDSKGKRIWFTEKAQDLLEEKDQPYKLARRFPCPKPAVSISTTDTMVPVAEFMIYKDQAIALDTIEERLDKLTNAARAVGVYPGKNSGDIVELSNKDDGKLIPVDTANFGKEGNLRQQIEWLPLGEVVQAIENLERRKIVLKNEIFELTGISDIVRGATDPRETAKAQGIKGAFGNLRLRPRREPMEEFIQDVYAIMAEIIASEFASETLELITGEKVTPDMEKLLRNNALLGFRVDVETDSTVHPNQEIEQEETVKFVEAIGTLLERAIPLGAQVPQLVPFLGQMIMHTASQFKGGRSLEQALEDALEQLEQATAQPQQEPPNPELIKIQADAQNDAEKNRIQAEKNQRDWQLKLIQIAGELQLKAQIEGAKFELDKFIADAEIFLSNKKIEMAAANDSVDIPNPENEGSAVRVGGEPG